MAHVKETKWSRRTLVLSWRYLSSLLTRFKSSRGLAVLGVDDNRPDNNGDGFSGGSKESRRYNSEDRQAVIDEEMVSFQSAVAQVRCLEDGPHE